MRLLPPSAAPATPVQVEVEGTPGVRFEGTLGELPEARAITGVVPASFSLNIRLAITDPTKPRAR